MTVFLLSCSAKFSAAEHRFSFTKMRHFFIAAAHTGLIFYGYFDIFICLVIISWALKTQDKVIYGFALATFAVILGFLYYSLDVTFLIKSLSMFLSGLILLLLTLSLMLFKQKEEFGI